jgi:hypothetical protein
MLKAPFVAHFVKLICDLAKASTPGARSGHLTQAVAAGFGFENYETMKLALDRIDRFNPPWRVFDTEAFADRMRTFGVAIPDDFLATMETEIGGGAAAAEVDPDIFNLIPESMNRPAAIGLALHDTFDLPVHMSAALVASFFGCRDFEHLAAAIDHGKVGFYDEELSAELRAARLTVQSVMLMSAANIDIDQALGAIELLRPTSRNGENNLKRLQDYLGFQADKDQSLRGKKKRNDSDPWKDKPVWPDPLSRKIGGWMRTLDSIGWDLRLRDMPEVRLNCSTVFDAYDRQGNEYEVWFTELDAMPGDPDPQDVAKLKRLLAKHWNDRDSSYSISAGLVLIFTRALYWRPDESLRTVVYGGLLWKHERWSHFTLVPGGIDFSLAQRDELKTGLPSKGFLRKYATRNNIQLAASLVANIETFPDLKSIVLVNQETGTDWLTGHAVIKK